MLCEVVNTSLDLIFTNLLLQVDREIHPVIPKDLYHPALSVKVGVITIAKNTCKHHKFISKISSDYNLSKRRRSAR